MVGLDKAIILGGDSESGVNLGLSQKGFTRYPSSLQRTIQNCSSHLIMRLLDQQIFVPYGSWGLTLSRPAWISRRIQWQNSAKVGFSSCVMVVITCCRSVSAWHGEPKKLMSCRFLNRVDRHV